MGRRAVPLLVALADTDERAVAHVEGYQELLALPGRDGALAQYHVVGVDIIVDSGEAILFMQAHPVQYDVDHSPAVERGEPLYQLHIVDIFIEEPALDIGELTGQAHADGAVLPHLLDDRANLLSSPGGFELLYLLLYLISGVAAQGLIALLTVILGGLLAEAAGARVDYQVESAVVVGIYLDKVIAPAERTDAARGADGIDKRSAAELREVYHIAVLMCGGADIRSGGHSLANDSVEPLEVDIPLAKHNGLHTAAYVHAHHSGHDPIADSHSSAYGTA